MASKKAINVEIDGGQPPCLIFADSFAINRVGELFIDLDFHCARSGESITIRVSTEAIEMSREGFLKYLNQMGIPTSVAPGPTKIHSSKVVIADFIGLARHGSSAEYMFHAISWKVALDSKSGSKKSSKPTDPEISATGFCTAMVRSSVDLQLHWIGALYSL